MIDGLHVDGTIVVAADNVTIRNTLVQGGGDGYYYSEFQAGGLPAGEYTLTATRNGEPVAVTSFTKAG